MQCKSPTPFFCVLMFSSLRTICRKEYSLPTKLCWHLFNSCWAHSYVLSAVPLIQPLPKSHCLHYFSIVVGLNPGNVKPPTLFFFKYVLVLLLPLNFHMHFRISLSVFVKTACWNFDRSCTECVNQMRNFPVYRE